MMECLPVLSYCIIIVSFIDDNLIKLSPEIRLNKLILLDQCT